MSTVDIPASSSPELVRSDLSGWRRMSSGIRWGFVLSVVARAFALPAGLLALPTLASWSPFLLILLGAPLIVSAFARGRAFWDWTAYVVGFVLFVVLRAAVDEIGFPVRAEYVVILDEYLGLGSLPTVTLQELLGGAVFDWIMIVVYVSFFIVPALVAIGLWLLRRGMVRFVAATLLCYAGGLLLHLVLPTVPPWMASAQGLIPPIQRVVYDVAFPAVPQIYEAGYRVSQNDVAAMPSMHLAVAVLAALAMVRLHGYLRPVALLYVLAMMLSIVYLGEHYLIDGVVGLLLAVGCWRVVQRLEPHGVRRTPEIAVARPTASARIGARESS